MTSEQKNNVLECLGLAESIAITLNKYLAKDKSPTDAETDRLHFRMLAKKLRSAESIVDIAVYQYE